MDCHSKEQELTAKYRTYGWLYYMDELIFKLVYWSIICIFLLTSLRLSYILKLDEATTESRMALGQGFSAE